MAPRFAIAVALGLVAASHAAEAQDETPTMNGAPCVALTSFANDAVEEGFVARGELVNVCPRAMEVELCFALTAPAEDGSTEQCIDAALRPEGEIQVSSAAAPQPLGSPTLRYGFLPIDDSLPD